VWPHIVSLIHVAQQYTRVTAGIGTDQLWAALRQWGASTLTERERDFNGARGYSHVI